MPRRRVGGWLPTAAIAAVGVVETAVFATQGRLLAAAIVLVVLGVIAWLLSPAAFPGTRPGTEPGSGVVVYWRPGCTYCLRLRWSLGRLARRARWIDIWADEEAAAYVRGVNDGDETVPTVVVAGTVRTNPDVAWVRAALHRG